MPIHRRARYSFVTVAYKDMKTHAPTKASKDKADLTLTGDWSTTTIGKKVATGLSAAGKPQGRKAFIKDNMRASYKVYYVIKNGAPATISQADWTDKT